MLKNRSIHVKLVRDADIKRPTPKEVELDTERLIENIVVGICAIIVVYKASTLIGNSAEHLVTTKIK